MDASARPALSTTLELEVAMQERCARSADYAEGANAFREKRPPQFTGLASHSPVVADEHRLGVQRDAEALAHAAGDLARERHQLGGGRAAAVDERERVLGRDADAAVAVAARGSRRARSATPPRS